MNVAPDWWKTFFRGLPVELWHRAVPPEQTRNEADGIASLLELAAGARVLDVPCGSGRLSLELASRGHALVGVDISDENIDMANEAARDLRTDDPARLEFHLLDMATLPWVDEFDAAICMGNSFGYFDDDGTAGFVTAIRRALRPAGRVMIDTPMLLSHLGHKQERCRDWHGVDGYWMLSECRYDASTKRWLDENVFIHGARTQREAMSQRVWEPAELVDFVTAGGFEDVRLCGDLDGRSWTVDAPRCLVIGRCGSE